VWWLGGGADWTIGLALDSKAAQRSLPVIVGLDAHLMVSQQCRHSGLHLTGCPATPSTG
jgi:hypothetical protein